MPASSENGSPRQPWWVWVCVKGLSSRGSALVCVWLLLALAAAGTIVSFWDWRGWAGLVFLIGAWWYWRAIRWMDRHGSWK